MFERLAKLVLGERVTVPEELPPESLPGGITIRRGRLVPVIGGILGRMRGPAAAVTLRRTIVLNPKARLTPALLAHELTHVRQWQQDPLFPIRYSLATLRHGYHNNPYEVEARTLASELTSSRRETV